MDKLVKYLNRTVANFGVLYTKLHNYHWFVTGEQFFAHHALFEKYYDEVTEHFDAVAERLLMIEAKPVATLKEFLDIASVKEATGKESVKEMFATTIADFTLVERELTETIKIAQDLGDEVTVDLLIGITASLQKHLWMLKATQK